MIDNDNSVSSESHLRSVLKALSWRFVATGTTFVIAYLVTGKLSFATSIASVEVVAKMVLYYFHERAWQILPRGRLRTLFNQKKS